MLGHGKAQKRIVFYLRNLRTGGIQRVVLTLANGLADRGCAVDIILANGGGALMEEVGTAVRVHALDSNRVLTSLPAFIRHVRRFQPHAVVSAPDSINLVLPWLRRFGLLKARTILTVHNNMSKYAEDEGVWYHRMLPHLIRHSYPHADQIVTVSKGIADDLFRLSDELRAKTAVIHNPVVDSSIPVKARESIDHPWLRVEDHRVILGIGRFMPQKDFPLLLRAFARVKRQANDTKLILLGDGPDRRELRSLAKDLNIEGGVDMPGFVSNPYAYLSRASLFVLSSIHEGLPTVLVEALACGCPVVSTNCPSGPDEILEGGTWGPLVPVGDVSALAQAMITTLESPPDAAQLKQRAESFSVDAAVDRYYKALFPEIDLQAA